MRPWSIGLTLILALLSLPLGHAQAPARNVVVITLDGLRWQEMFTGADRAYFKQDKNGVPGAAEKRFWRSTPEERRTALMPFMWGTIASSGQVFGDPSKASRAHLTNGLWFSYPGLQRDVLGGRRSARRQQRQGSQSQHHRARVAQRPAGLSGSRRRVRLVGRAALRSSTPAAAASRSEPASRLCQRRRPNGNARSTSSRPICRPIGSTARSTRRSSMRRSRRCAPPSRACSTSCSARATSGRTQAGTTCTWTRRSVPTASSSASGRRCSRSPSTPIRRRCS